MEAIRRATVPWDDEMDRLWAATDRQPGPMLLEPERPRTLAPDHVPAAPRQPDRLATTGTPSWMLRVVAIAVAGLVVLVGGAALVDWGRVRLDDLRYGRPRTTHLAGFVGHGDGEGIPTQLMATNLNRRITVIEIPGGDPARIRTIAGPYLVGKDEDLTVATMRLSDVNGDSHPDLLLRVKNEEVVYINDRGEFRLMTRAERPAVERTLEGGK
ncbi:MAG: hypothetical protein IT340_22825 [Chloroflexi bacterium]|nr:hypothetical protein [Chloroflexota bacterium]